VENAEALKRAAAERAAEWIEDGMALGEGILSSADLVEALARVSAAGAPGNGA